MQNKRIKKLTLLAILTALSVTFGFVAKIPTPTGLLTLVDAGIYFTAFYLGKKEGAIVGGLSAFLIDLLLSAPQWMFISLFSWVSSYFSTAADKIISWASRRCL